MRTWRAERMASALALALVLLPGCRGCSQSTPSPVTSTYYPIELGNGSNHVQVRKRFFLGHRVERFKLRVRLVNPGRTNPWPAGISLSFVSNQGGFQQFSGPPATTETDGSFWTQEFNANWTQIRLGSNGIVSFDAGQPRLEILGVERHFSPGVDRESVPTPTFAVDDPTHQRLIRGSDIIGFSPGVVETQHYVIPVSTSPRLGSIYISPRLLSLNNDMGIKMHRSSTGFVAWDANVTWIEPAPGDSGIYHEFTQPANQRVFVTVVGTAIGPYLIQHTWLVERFGGIVMERDAQMAAAPVIDVAAIRAGAGTQAPFNSQIANFLHETADFDRRILETMVLASAFALDGSNGQMRFRSAELHRDIDFWRNVDVQFSICASASNPACRANAGGFRIDLFTLDLGEPISGGGTFHHEWGHWDYGLPDEYIDVTLPPPTDFTSSLVVDPNSLMGTQATTEFCTPQNHISSQVTGGADSSWTQIQNQYAGVIQHPLVNTSMSHGRYLDVLGKLDVLFTLTIR